MKTVEDVGRLAQLAEEFRAVRAQTEALAAPLSPEDQQVQSMPDASPTKWHRAHTTWFFEEFVAAPHADGYERFHPNYGYLFNSYYEAVGPRQPRPQRGLLTRPAAADIGRYRRHVDQVVTELLSADHGPAGPDAGLAGLITLGLHHEQQHQELLLMDILHAFWCNPMRSSYRDDPFALTGRAADELTWTEHPGGIVATGFEGDGFCFDNEQPHHESLLRPFRIADRLVTNGEWLEFMADGGYRRAELWLSEGWATVKAEAWDAPLYWDHDGVDWMVFGLRGLGALDPAEPVCHVSLYEADAFARWTGARLPLENEWEVVALPHAADGVTPAGNTIETGALHPRPAEPGPGVRQLFGDVWEWTSSAYLGYPGFRPEAGAVGEYNGKFMCNQFVLRGGGCATPAAHLRPTYRNFFPPSARWAFSGVRLATDI